ncbi:peptide deformylase [Mycoplasma iguanae]|uniref:Peptide deformylase n=1 Tax=Mycoplasma iguanae TaxID=292461 RepID=A0ABY5R8M2_9MOLU|nr:peptide deformylase [Mycoplasma iguanae]UVD81631.1 peptide deformylase [Mycoplasma iguanae]
MNIKPVYLPQFPKKVLREKSQDVLLPLSQEDIDLAEQMIKHIDYSQEPGQKIYRPGVGVAAVQYGILKNMFYIYLPPEKSNDVGFKDVIINPQILGYSEAEVALSMGEGCLSVPDSYEHQNGYVVRKNKIVVKAYSYFQKQYVTFRASGYLAIVFQHELDHLQGKLFIDRINKEKPWAKKDGVEYL